MTESSHSHLIPQRRQKNGLAWTIENAGSMVQMHIKRANDQRDDYLKNLPAA